MLSNYLMVMNVILSILRIKSKYIYNLMLMIYRKLPKQIHISKQMDLFWQFFHIDIMSIRLYIYIYIYIYIYF